MKVSPAVGALCSLLLTGACASPVASLDNLIDLHRERPEAEAGAPLQLTRTITHRGRCHRAWNSLRGFFWLDPNVKSREIEDPIKFGLYQLEVVLDDRDELDEWERARAMLAMGELVRRSPSRALQAECLRVLQVYTAEAELQGRRQPLDQPLSDEDWEELEGGIRALEKVAAAEPDLALEMIEGEGEAIRATAETLEGCDLARADRSQRLALAALGIARLELEHPATAAARALCRKQVGRTVFLSAIAGCRPTVADRVEPQAEAARLLLALDPYSGSRLLGELMERFIHPAGQIAILQQLARSEADPSQLDPSFRRIVSANLFEPDAARRYWSSRAIATLLDLEELSDRRELQSRWEALGGIRVPEGS